MNRIGERTIALLGVALLVVAAVAAVAAPATGQAEQSPEFEAAVPAEYDFSGPTTADGVARVDGERFEALSAAVDAADPGETITLAVLRRSDSTPSNHRRSKGRTARAPAPAASR